MHCNGADISLLSHNDRLRAQAGWCSATQLGQLYPMRASGPTRWYSAARLPAASEGFSAPVAATAASACLCACSTISDAEHLRSCMLDVVASRLGGLVWSLAASQAIRLEFGTCQGVRDRSCWHPTNTRQHAHPLYVICDPRQCPWILADFHHLMLQHRSCPIPASHACQS